MLYTKYQGSRPCGVRQEDFFTILHISAYVKHVTPEWVHFWPQRHNLIKLGGSPLSVIHTKYQGSRTYVSRQEQFFQCVCLHEPM